MKNQTNVLAEFNYNTELTINAIQEYIEGEHHSGALLATGMWGSGKTYYLKSIKDSYNKDNYCISFTSLFGINTREDLVSTVKKDVFSAFANTDDDNKETTSKLFNGLKTLTGLFKKNSKFVSGIDTIININYLDFIELSPVLFNKKLVLIFDDFERCGLETKTLLGVINNFCENQGIKVIIIAEEDKIKKKKYSEFKEKVISKTIRLDLDYKYIIKKIINDNKYGSENYQIFLESHIDLIDLLLVQSGYQNLRSIKAAVNDFSKIYDIFSYVSGLSKTGTFNEYQQEALQFMLSQFVAFTLEARACNDIYKDLFDYSEAENVTPEDDKASHYMNKYSNNIFDSYNASKAIVLWISNNIFDKEQLESDIKEIIKRYTPDQKSDLDLFLTSNILSLEWTTFTKGYKDALSSAYNGKLTSEQLLDLLTKINKARIAGIPLPEEPDYNQMEQAYTIDSRINEQEPIFGGSDGPVEAGAVNLRKKIKQFIATRQIKKINSEYYSQCLLYFKNPEKNQFPNFLQNTSISIDFDNQLMETILNSYENMSNRNRINISNSFNNIRFSVQSPDELVTGFIRKLSLLEEKLGEDHIAKVNLQEFVTTINKKFGIN